MLSPAFMAPISATGGRLDARIPGVYLKDSSVEVANLAPELRAALATMRDVLSALSAGPLVITSGNDGIHLPGSRHYVDDAVDVRSLHIRSREQREAIGKAVARAIGARLKLSGGPPVGTDPGLMLWVEERPDAVPHFHLQIFRRPGAEKSRGGGGSSWTEPDSRQSGSGAAGLVILGTLAALAAAAAYALSRRNK